MAPLATGLLLQHCQGNPPALVHGVPGVLQGERGRDIPITSRPEAVTSLSSPSLARWDQGQPPQNPRHWPSGAAAPRCGKWYAIALVTTCNKKQDSAAPSWPRIGVRRNQSAFHCTSCGYWANGGLNVAQTILASRVGATARGEAFSVETSTIHP